MKFVKNLIITIIGFTLCICTAQAACDFIIDIGDKKTKFVEKIGEPMPMFEGQFMLPVPSTKVCPNDDLSMNIAVEYIFLEDFLAAIRMVVLNDGTNAESKKLKLMKYAKKNYGDFDTGQNPEIFNNFKAWETLPNQKIAIYKMLYNEDNLIEEELFITNKKYDERLAKFYYDLEVNELNKDLGINE